MATVPFYLLTVLPPAPLAALAAGLGMLALESSQQPSRCTRGTGPAKSRSSETAPGCLHLLPL